jgi:alpha-beta hydrolase superfamily lysophospholipase/ubiquinone/menaquinone biosynthesis C-methylase UbiE
MSKREAKEDQFETFDGTKLHYRTWEPLSDDSSKKALIVMHRGHEHSGRLDDLIDGMDCDDFWAFAYDARGHGKSPGPRGYAPDFSYLVKDMDHFVRMISVQHNIPTENIFVVANSVGAVVASTWVHDYAPPIKGMILAAPAFTIKLYIPLALTSLRVLNLVKKKAFISSYVKSKFLTHDVNEQKKYDEDELITPDIAVNILIGLNDNAARVVTDAGAIHVPTLIFSAEKDWIVHTKPQEIFFEGLSSAKKKFVTLPGFYHGVLYEEDRQIAFDECVQFIKECYEGKTESVSLVKADIEGYTQKEYDRLVNYPVSLISAVNYFFQRVSLATIGRLSKGIRVGLKYGFDSGMSLDHVYKNNAVGITPIGKMIDYFYINAIGWRGIRKRKVHMQQALDFVIDEMIADGKPIRIMDIAGGPGRYLTEVAKKCEHHDIKCLVRDYEKANIDEGIKIAESLHCHNVEFKVSDAFNPQTYQDQEFRPNVLIVSGLFELFTSNELVLKAIEGATAILEEGGYILYTGQPWHPQLELIANTLPNRDGAKWIMRRRTQKEMDELFHLHGAEKIDMKIDKWGIFTVSTANFKKNKSNQKAS